MFESFEESRQKRQPAALYQFIYGPSGQAYNYTNAETQLVIDGITYTPMPIDREAITSSGTLDKASLIVKVALIADVCELFRVYPPTQPVTLIIREGHLNDPDSQFLVVWTGRVLSCKRESPAELTCEPASTSMKRPGLRLHYQIGCPHALYMGQPGEPGCHANKAAATVSGTITAINGASVTLAAGWNGSRDKSKFLGGMISWESPLGGTEYRTILRVNAATDTLSLTGIVRDLTAGATISVILGCNHQLSDCEFLHGVVPDYGGQWLIPTKNPIGIVNNYV